MEIYEKPKILIVDDKKENLLVLETIFMNEPYEIIQAQSGNEALSHVISHNFAIILLDVQMPEMDGFETAELIRQNKLTSHIPIIFITAISKEKKFIFKGYKFGAVDFLCKPLEPEILKSKVKVFIDLFLQKRTIEEKNSQLNKANETILEQQKALMDEERNRVLLQMAGATAHEVNQPLMTLLANIEMIQTTGSVAEEMKKRLSAIEKSGKRISSIVKKIQSLKQYQTTSYTGGEEIIDIHLHDK